MSSFNDASIVQIPSGYKASTLYSIKPSSGAGDFSVVRATTATRVNESGLIESVAANVPRIDYLNGGCGELLVEPQRTNLFTYSEDFDSGNWQAVGFTKESEYSKIGLNFFEYSTSSPNTGASNHLRDLSVAFSAGNTVASIFIDLDNTNSNFCALRINDGSNDARISLNLSTFEITNNGNGSIADAGYEWRRFLCLPFKRG